ncbi:MAG: hypothetical protein QM758_15065 [Armatimonas sp.]
MAIELLEKTLCGLEIGEPITFGGMTVFPLKGSNPPREYVTLDEAMRDRLVEITELGSGGSVPELRLVNNGDRPIFLLDGEEVIGAQQNRVLNLSVLAPARSTQVIPVSCVEQGRWQVGQSQFQGGTQVHFASGRARKMQRVSENMENGQGHRSDQSEVWSDIQGLFARLGGSSNTQAMADAFAENLEEIERYVSAFRRVPGQTGLVVALNGRIHGMDLFDSAETLRYLLPKIVRSWALEAIASGTKESRPVATGSLDKFLTQVKEANVSRQTAVGMGEDLRLSGPKLAGAALSGFGRVVHLAAFCR